MNLSRGVTLWIHFVFDHILPPVLRDQKWFMWLPFKLLFREKAEIFFSFKATAAGLSPEKFRDIYTQAAPVFIQRETDLNVASIAAIEELVLGQTVLDVACGRGFLAKRLASKYRVTGADIVLDHTLITARPEISFFEANLEHLPFDDGQFDTVICAHTLEHVQHPAHAISELRRVTARRLLVVVPRQRPYRYTFDLHLHFFPYAHDLINFMGHGEGYCRDVGGDWLYLWDRTNE